jgi:hypothetical protein
VAAQSTDHIGNDLEEENIDLAHKIDGSAKKRNIMLDMYFGAKMHQPLLYDGTPLTSQLQMTDDGIIGENEEQAGSPPARLNTTIADLVHAHGLSFLSVRLRASVAIFEWQSSLYRQTIYKPPKCKLVAGWLLTANHDECMRCMYDQLALQVDTTFGLAVSSRGWMEQLPSACPW